MQRFWNYARRNLIPGQVASAGPALGATVTVYEAGTLVLATLYGDDLAPPTPKANPFTADLNDAYLDFYAANGHYDVELSGGVPPNDITTPYVWGDVLLSDVGGFPLAVVQSELGGSMSLSPNVTLDPETVEAVNYIDTYIPWVSLPAGVQANLQFFGRAPTGGAMTLELYDLLSTAVVLTDPVPFTDDTQFIQHSLLLPAPVPLVVQVLRLRATVTGGVGNPCFFFGRIIYTP